MANQTLERVTEIDPSTRLAYDRTRLAHKKTVMARRRTAISLITFGFAIYKFCQIEVRAGDLVERLIGPRICAGWDYHERRFKRGMQPAGW